MGLLSKIRGILFRADERSIARTSDVSSTINNTLEDVDTIDGGAKDVNLGLTLRTVFDTEDSESL